MIYVYSIDYGQGYIGCYCVVTNEQLKRHIKRRGIKYIRCNLHGDHDPLVTLTNIQIMDFLNMRD